MRTRFRWVLIFWMFLVSAIAYLDRVNISIAGQSIAREFHLTNIQLGAVFSAFVLGYALFQAPGGWLADRIGPRRVLALGVVWWGVFTTLITFLPPSAGGLLAAMMAIRFCLGMGEAVVYPASNCVVAAWIPSAERGLANGLIFAGVGFGAGITPPIIAYVMLNYGWRASFWLSTLLGLAAGGIWYVIARDRPEKHPWIAPEELAEIRAGLPKQDGEDKGKRVSLGAVLKNRHIIIVTLSYFSYGYIAYIFFSWFFIYLSSVRGLNLRDSSFYTMLPFIAMAIGSSVGGWISDRVTRRWGKRAGRCGLAVAGIGLSAVFIALGTQVASAQLASVVLAGGAGALYLSQSSFWSVSADIGGRSAGLVSGLMNMGGQLGSTVTAVVTPWIAGRYGWTWSFLAAAGLCALGALAWVFVDPDARIAD